MVPPQPRVRINPSYQREHETAQPRPHPSSPTNTPCRTPWSAGTRRSICSPTQIFPLELWERAKNGKSEFDKVRALDTMLEEYPDLYHITSPVIPHSPPRADKIFFELSLPEHHDASAFSEPEDTEAESEGGSRQESVDAGEALLDELVWELDDPVLPPFEVPSPPCIVISPPDDVPFQPLNEPPLAGTTTHDLPRSSPLTSVESAMDPALTQSEAVIDPVVKDNALHVNAGQEDVMDSADDAKSKDAPTPSTAQTNATEAEQTDRPPAPDQPINPLTKPIDPSQDPRHREASQTTLTQDITNTATPKAQVDASSSSPTAEMNAAEEGQGPATTPIDPSESTHQQTSQAAPVKDVDTSTGPKTSKAQHVATPPSTSGIKDADEVQKGLEAPAPVPENPPTSQLTPTKGTESSVTLEKLNTQAGVSVTATETLAADEGPKSVKAQTDSSNDAGNQETSQSTPAQDIESSAAPEKSNTSVGAPMTLKTNAAEEEEADTPTLPGKAKTLSNETTGGQPAPPSSSLVDAKTSEAVEANAIHTSEISNASTQVPDVKPTGSLESPEHKAEDGANRSMSVEGTLTAKASTRTSKVHTQASSACSSRDVQEESSSTAPSAIPTSTAPDQDNIKTPESSVQPPASRQFRSWQAGQGAADHLTTSEPPESGSNDVSSPSVPDATSASENSKLPTPGSSGDQQPPAAPSKDSKGVSGAVAVDQPASRDDVNKTSTHDATNASHSSKSLNHVEQDATAQNTIQTSNPTSAPSPEDSGKTASSAPVSSPSGPSPVTDKAVQSGDGVTVESSQSSGVQQLRSKQPAKQRGQVSHATAASSPASHAQMLQRKQDHTQQHAQASPPVAKSPPAQGSQTNIVTSDEMPHGAHGPHTSGEQSLRESSGDRPSVADTRSERPMQEMGDADKEQPTHQGGSNNTGGTEREELTGILTAVSTTEQNDMGGKMQGTIKSKHKESDAAAAKDASLCAERKVKTKEEREEEERRRQQFVEAKRHEMADKWKKERDAHAVKRRQQDEMEIAEAQATMERQAAWEAEVQLAWFARMEAEKAAEETERKKEESKAKQAGKAQAEKRQKEERMQQREEMSAQGREERRLREEETKRKKQSKAEKTKKERAQIAKTEQATNAQKSPEEAGSQRKEFGIGEGMAAESKDEGTNARKRSESLDGEKDGREARKEAAATANEVSKQMEAAAKMKSEEETKDEAALAIKQDKAQDQQYVADRMRGEEEANEKEDNTALAVKQKDQARKQKQRDEADRTRSEAKGKTREKTALTIKQEETQEQRVAADRINSEADTRDTSKKAAQTAKADNADVQQLPAVHRDPGVTSRSAPCTPLRRYPPLPSDWPHSGQDSAFSGHPTSRRRASEVPTACLVDVTYPDSLSLHIPVPSFAPSNRPSQQREGDGTLLDPTERPWDETSPLDSAVLEPEIKVGNGATDGEVDDWVDLQDSRGQHLSQHATFHASTAPDGVSVIPGTVKDAAEAEPPNDAPSASSALLAESSTTEFDRQMLVLTFPNSSPLSGIYLPVQNPRNNSDEQARIPRIQRDDSDDYVLLPRRMSTTSFPQSPQRNNTSIRSDQERTPTSESPESLPELFRRCLEQDQIIKEQSTMIAKLEKEIERLRATSALPSSSRPRRSSFPLFIPGLQNAYPSGSDTT